MAYHLFQRFPLSNLHPAAAYHHGIVFLTSTPNVAFHVLSIELFWQCVCLSKLDTLCTALPHLRSLTISDPTSPIPSLSPTFPEQETNP